MIKEVIIFSDPIHYCHLAKLTAKINELVKCYMPISITTIKMCVIHKYYEVLLSKE